MMPNMTVHCQIYTNGRVIMPILVCYRKSKYNEWLGVTIFQLHDRSQSKDEIYRFRNKL